MRRFFKFLIWTVLSLFFIGFLFIATLPSLLSNSWVKNQTLQIVNRFIPAHLSAEALHLSWFGSQTIDNLEIKSKSGTILVSGKQFHTKTPLWRLLIGSREFGETTLISPYLNVIENKRKPLGLIKLLSNTETKNRARLPSFKEGLIIHSGTIVFGTDQIAPITISDIEMTSRTDPTHFQLTAKTVQGPVNGKIQAEGKLEEDQYVKTHIENFPTAVFDQLDKSQLFTTTIGDTLSFDVEYVKNQEGTFVKGRVSSPFINGDFKGSKNQTHFIFGPDSRFSWTITPALFQHIIPLSKQLNWKLANKTAVHVQIEELKIPLKLSELELSDISLKAQASLDNQTVVNSQMGQFSLNNFIARLNTEKGETKIDYSGDIISEETTHTQGNLTISRSREIRYHSNFENFPVSILHSNPKFARYAKTILNSNFNLTTDGIYKQGKLDSTFTIESQTIGLQGEIHGVLPQFMFSLKGTKKIDGKIVEMIGDHANFDLSGIAYLSNQSILVPKISGIISNPNWKLKIQGKLGEVGQQFSLNQVDLKMAGTLLHIPVEEIALKNGHFSFHFNGGSNTFGGEAQVSATLDGTDIKALEGNILVENLIRDGHLDLNQIKTSFQIDTDYFPISLLSRFYPERSDLLTLIGHRAQIHAAGTYEPSSEDRLVSLALNTKSQGFQLQFSIVLDKSLTVKQEQPGYLYWDMTPARYQTLTKILGAKNEVDFNLVQSVPIEVAIDRLILPNSPSTELGQLFFRTGFVGTMRGGPFIFMNRNTQETISFHQVKASIAGDDFSKAIAIRTEGLIAAANVPQDEKSAFMFDGQLLNFWTPEGHFNREGLAVQGELNLEFLPVRQITGIIPVDAETRTILQAVLGELVNARIYGSVSHLTGPLTIDIKASNFKAILPIQLENGILTLRDYVEAEITLTEAVSETLLKDINPLLITGAYSDHPIRIFLDPEGFMIPLRNYNFQNVHIHKAIIDIGKIRIRNGGQIQSLMEFLKAKDISPDGVMEAWFTPIFMSLENGVAHYKRFDALLAHNVHIALWGSIDIVYDRVSMTLGIAPTTLQQRFGILGLHKGDMFQLKMHGSTTKLDLDWGSAYTRIGIIIARTAGGGIGYLVGGLLEQIMQVFGDESAPPPTTTPFPWESAYPSDPTGIPQEAPPQHPGKNVFKKILEFLIP